MNKLLLDIETAPNIGHIWGLWKQNVSLSQLMFSGYVMCWAAKWVGKKRVYFSSIKKDTAINMLTEIHTLMSEADAIITWNGVKFDIPTLNRDFILNGLPPPPSVQQIDLIQIAQHRFKFVSNKLEYVTKALGCTEKMKVEEGHELWVKCMAGDVKAWDTMKKYNINDTCILEEIYNKMLPWIQGHPHVGLNAEDPDACPNCGGKNLQSRGWAYTKLSKYRRFQCTDCGTWSRVGKRIMSATLRSIHS